MNKKHSQTMKPSIRKCAVCFESRTFVFSFYSFFHVSNRVFCIRDAVSFPEH